MGKPSLRLEGVVDLDHGVPAIIRAQTHWWDRLALNLIVTVRSVSAIVPWFKPTIRPAHDEHATGAGYRDVAVEASFESDNGVDVVPLEITRKDSRSMALRPVALVVGSVSSDTVRDAVAAAP